MSELERRELEAARLRMALTIATYTGKTRWTGPCEGCAEDSCRECSCAPRVTPAEPFHNEVTRRDQAARAHP